MVLALRVWRPDVVLCDPAESKDPGDVIECLMAEAMREAFKQAADAKSFPEQLAQLGLKVWKPSKLYAPDRSADTPRAPGTVVLDMGEVRTRLQASVRDFAGPSAGLLAEDAVVLPRLRAFRLLASNIEGAEKHGTLMEGVPQSPVGDSRRAMPPLEPVSPELLKALQTRVNLQQIIEQPLTGMTNPDRVMGSVGQILEKLPDAQGALAAHALATHLVRLGQWHLAREAYLQMVEHYPTHPLTADAYRWLIKHNASSETRRRHELGQFLITSDYRTTPGPTSVTMDVALEPRQGKGKPRAEKAAASSKKDEAGKQPEQPLKPGTVVKGPESGWEEEQHLTMVHDRKEILRWHQGSLDIEKHLAAFGPLLSEDPALQFCLHAARRNMGDFETPRKWFSDFVSRQPAGPWRDAAAAELWLSQRQGPPPKPVLVCQQTDTRPFLDGQFDDACWKGQQFTTLQNAVGATSKEAPTKVMLAHDNDFLYLALRCEHPAGQRVPPVKGRKRDEDLRAFDRVSLILDLDRDYATAFHFQVDQRGCVRESCWGDLKWDPRWFVAVHSEENAWQIEAAIPLIAMTGDLITPGKTWCCHVIRTLPGRGVQSLSLPAGVPEDDPRLEGMGLLMFKADPKFEAKQPRPAGRMGHVTE
jgi:hypothetical protein